VRLSTIQRNIPMGFRSFWSAACS